MSKFKLITLAVCFIFVVGALAVTIGSTPPGGYPSGESVEISSGSGLNTVARELSERGLIKSEFVFKAYVVILKGIKRIKTGKYLLSAPESSLRLAYRLINGEEGYPQVRVTIPEGNDYRGVADIISRAIPEFDKKSFLPLAKTQEGYLFPDTYFWPTNLTPERAISDMKKVFDIRTSSIKEQTLSSKRSFDDVMKMASLVEREATSTKDRMMVAGILWKRLDIGMPLQSDVSFYYVIGTTSRELTLDDLKMDSPYNLYTNLGLPPTPIVNPGLGAITDTLNATKSQYYYFLFGKDGNMHYATTFDGHIANKDKYLGK